MHRSLPARAFILVLFGCLAVQTATAQYFRQSSYWKTHRKEICMGFGITNFLGELGGRNQIGSPFVWDLELSQTRPAITFGYRYYIAEKMAVRARLAYGVIAGNDNLTTEPFRQNRNLNFKSDLFEGSVVFELHFYREELGHVYDLRGVKGTKSSRVGLYVFAGVGGMYFDPKTQFNNAWVRLKPLGTEGQGLPDGAAEYSNYGVCIPMGVGVRKAFSKAISAGLELQYTKTFTDYMDDVSGSYYDPLALAAARGPEAAYLSDPSLGLIPGQTIPGAQRGDSSDKDAYLFLTAQVHYKLFKYRTGAKKYRARVRRQKIVF